MSYVEMDHEEFIKAIKLLHSRSPESSDELKRLLDAYCAKQMCINESKKSKDAMPYPLPMADKRFKPSGYDSEATDNEDNDNIDIDSMNKFSCVICKQMDSHPVIECQECHHSYHYECHKPPINKKNFADFRSNWNCSKCSKNINKKSAKSSFMNKSLLSKSTNSSSANSIPSTEMTTSVSINYSNSPFKDTLSKPTNTMKMTESGLKRPVQKFSPYSTNLKPGVSTITSTNRTSAAINLIAVNKNKINTNSGQASFTSTSSFSSLDKRLPNLKKVKTNQKFGN